MSKARITLKGENPKDLDGVVSQILEIAKVLKMKVSGPIHFPRRAVKVSTRRTPCGDGSDTYEHWEKRISQRLIDLEGEEKSLKQVLRIKVPTDVFVKISLK